MIVGLGLGQNTAPVRATDFVALREMDIAGLRARPTSRKAA